MIASISFISKLLKDWLSTDAVSRPPSSVSNRFRCAQAGIGRAVVKWGWSGLLLFWMVAPAWASLIPPTISQIPSQDQYSDAIQLELGFGNRIKLGCWQPFWVRTPDRLVPHQFEITVLDGDETPITYRGPLHAVGSDLNERQGYLKLGKGFGTAELKLFDRDGAEIARQSFPLKQLKGLQIVSPTDSIALTIEPNQTVANAVVSTSTGQNVKGVCSKLDRAGQLPIESHGYEGVRAVYLVAADIPWLENVSKRQWDALDGWVRNGGQLILSIDPANPQLATGGPLARFIDADVGESATVSSSSRLDNFASSSPLLQSEGDKLSLVKLIQPRGQVIVEQAGLPCIIRTGRGFGEIVLTAFDLSEPRLSEWSGYKNLVYRLNYHIQLQEAAQSQRISLRGKSVSHPGYDDLIGQLRVPLDQFSKVQFLSFNWIAVLIGLYILCIGPGDYFMLRRLTGKMELTWITFPLITLFFCGLAIWISSRTRAEAIQINQLEIVDIDAESQQVRGMAWSSIYSPRAGVCEVSLLPENALNLKLESNLISWQGLPGKGYGGMEARSGIAVIREPYLHRRVGLSEDGQAGFSQLQDMPLNVASSKPLLVQYRGEFPEPIQSRLRVRPRGLGLQGTLINPFPFQLTNCRLLFENDAYILEEPWDPGVVIAVESEMKVRTLAGYLTRRRSVAGESAKSQNTQNVPWDINDTRIPRIADVMMFFAAAGGANYTGLTHNYQSDIDLSEQLNLGRAVLVAEIDGLGTSLAIDGKSAEKSYDQVTTFVRIVLPVSSLQQQSEKAR
jgi:hypothetical protein